MAYTTSTELFTGICDAIRGKEGTTDPIPHQDIPARIAALRGEEVIDYSLLDTPPIDAEPLVAWTVDSYTAGDTILKNSGTLGTDIQLVGDTPTLTKSDGIDLLLLRKTCAYITFPATSVITAYITLTVPVSNSTTNTDFAVQAGGDTAAHCVGFRRYNYGTLINVTNKDQTFEAAAPGMSFNTQVICVKIDTSTKAIYADGFRITPAASIYEDYKTQGLYINSANLKYAGAAGEAYSSNPMTGAYLKEFYIYNSSHSEAKIRQMTAWLLARVQQDVIFEEANEEETPVAPTIPDDPYGIVETKPLFWLDASCVTDATTLTNKGTSTDVINATGLAVDETEDAISLASETGAFYADFTAISEATVYVIYKPTSIEHERGYDRCCVTLRDAGNTERSFRFYCEYMTECDNVAKFVHKIGFSDSVHYSDDSDYITAASVSKSGYHRAYIESACANLRDDIDDYNFSRVAANCVYADDTPLNNIPDNSYSIKAILVYDELHDSATVRKMTTWLNAKYRGL